LFECSENKIKAWKFEDGWMDVANSIQIPTYELKGSQFGLT